MGGVSKVEGPDFDFFLGGQGREYLLARFLLILVRREIRGQPAPG